MAPKLKKANTTSSDQGSVSSIKSRSVVSETSSLLAGSVSSAAAKAPLKVSKTIVRDRSIVFWTPVMVWPMGFLRAHKRQTIEYQSDSRLHNGKYPTIAPRLVGGIVIDLPTTDVERKVAELLEVGERASDEELSRYLDSLADQIRGRPRAQEGKRAVNVLSSALLQQLPQDTQQSVAA
jgi:hypothetical protein